MVAWVGAGVGADAGGENEGDGIFVVVSGFG